MPERLNVVRVALPHTEAVELSWDARTYLLDRLKRDDGTESIIAAFEAAGPTRPVELDAAERATLLRLLDRWASLAYDGFTSMLPELEQLRHALTEDVDGAVQRTQNT